MRREAEAADASGLDTGSRRIDADGQGGDRDAGPRSHCGRKQWHRHAHDVAVRRVADPAPRLRLEREVTLLDLIRRARS